MREDYLLSAMRAFSNDIIVISLISLPQSGQGLGGIVRVFTLQNDENQERGSGDCLLLWDA
jgi:hypothetical protein